MARSPLHQAPPDTIFCAQESGTGSLLWNIMGLTAAILFLALASRDAFASETVTLRLDWTALGYHAPFFLAVEKGYYKDAGLTVDILEGKGSGTTVQLVGNGSDTFGFADSALAAKAISTGVPVRVVFGIIRKSPASIAFPADRPMRKPQDLKGKTVMTCPGHGALVFFPAYLQAIGLKPGDVALRTVDCASVYTLVAQGLADAATSFTPAGRSIFARAGVKDVRVFDYAESGILLPSHGIVTSINVMKTQPDMVRRFLAATSRAWQEALKDPQTAAEALVKAKPLLKGHEDTLVTELRGYGDYVNTPGTQGKPFGWQSADEWKAAIDLMVTYLDVKPPSSVEGYFSNDFIAP